MGIIEGSIIGVIQGDTWRLDCSANDSGFGLLGGLYF